MSGFIMNGGKIDIWKQNQPAPLWSEIGSPHTSREVVGGWRRAAELHLGRSQKSYTTFVPKKAVMPPPGKCS